ncbi:MAG TPA: agmatinase family protein [Candidatus Polarisedimenticolaceae bacterium]|nr:agmatinase family protein [Candidatus Polarisedimenticolaceae bacterium]
MNEFAARPLALVGFPTDEHSSYLRGSADGPARIRSALRSGASNLVAEDGTDLTDRLDDLGDRHGSIEDAVRAVLTAGRRPLALGGDHSITFPIVTALAGAVGPLDLLQFDAHPDLYDEYGGDRLSHASPFARILERGLARRLVQVGVRTMNEAQRRQVERFGVEVVEMRSWRVGLPLAFDGPLYLSVDLDVLDPAYAPGVSHLEPGGATTRQLIDAIREVRGAIVGADVVELNPRRDPSDLTPAVAAKLVKELAARMLRR